MKALALLPPMLLFAACAQTASDPRRPKPIAPLLPVSTLSGLDKIIGRDARALVGMFGPAAQDVREADARRLQFAGGGCILDAYLYPPARGREPLVTHIDTRTPDGRPAERTSCAAAIAKGR